MDRRAFICGAAGLAVAAPVASMAQQPGRSYRMCWLSSGAARTETYNLALVARLRELGFVEGRNLAIEYRSAEGRTERLGPLAADLARQGCDVFLAPGTDANLRAVEQASRDTPIVVVATDYDPVATRHVASLARPGGRVTGVSHLQSDLPAKRIELLKQLVPGAKTIAVLSDTVSSDQLALTQAAAARLGVALAVHEFKRAPYDYERAFAGFAQAKADAFLAMASGLFVAARQTIPALATKHRLPSMFNNRLWAESGGLLSYGVNFSTTYRRTAELMALILNGARPADIPMEQASAVELVVNLKTAKALGIAVPPAVLARADEVIQ
jgi:putative ABC transport system substrate-binding protein